MLTGPPRRREPCAAPPAVGDSRPPCPPCLPCSPGPPTSSGEDVSGPVVISAVLSAPARQAAASGEPIASTAQIHRRTWGELGRLPVTGRISRPRGAAARGKPRRLTGCRPWSPRCSFGVHCLITAPGSKRPVPGSSKPKRRAFRHAAKRATGDWRLATRIRTAGRRRGPRSRTGRGSGGRCSGRRRNGRGFPSAARRPGGS
jgi:hypothetical protein